MASRRKFSSRIRQQLIEAAQNRCSYCRCPGEIGIPLIIEHIISLAANGSNELNNLCLPCHQCNTRKGAKTSAVDPFTSHVYPLFHPNKQRWYEHFAWNDDGILLIGLTGCGRATIDYLRLNDERWLSARYHWIVAEIHPPVE